MQNKQETIDKVTAFMKQCVTSNGEHPPEELTYLDISKVESFRYATQTMETIKIFFRSKGKQSNNKPYTFRGELPVGTATLISNDLYSIRTEATNGY